MLLKFHENYPFIKMTFFNKPHQPQESSLKNEMIDIEKIEKKLSFNNPVYLEINENQTTGKLESIFSKMFGLNIQIYRLEGHALIQTVGTDEFTLKEQNEIGAQKTLEDYNINTNKWELEKKL
jgi:hypothetical protein